MFSLNIASSPLLWPSFNHTSFSLPCVERRHELPVLADGLEQLRLPFGPPFLPLSRLVPLSLLKEGLGRRRAVDVVRLQVVRHIFPQPAGLKSEEKKGITLP